MQSRFTIIFSLLAVAGVAQTQANLERQMRLDKAAPPGSLLVVAADGVSVSSLSGCTVVAGALQCSGPITAGSTLTQPGEIELPDVSGAHRYTWLAPNSIPVNVRFQLPSLPPKAGQLMAFSAPDPNDVSWLAFVDPVAPVVTPTLVLSGPTSLGCVATSAVGVYKLPRIVKSVAVYRNGSRASAPGEFTLAADTVTLVNPMSGEIVLCDYTY